MWEYFLKKSHDVRHLGLERASNNNNNNKGKATGKKEARKICGKFHKDECWLKNGGGRRNKKPQLDKESLNMIAEVLGLTQKTYKEGTCKYWLPEAEKLFVMGAASQDQGIILGVTSVLILIHSRHTKTNTSGCSRRSGPNKNDCHSQCRMSQKCYTQW